MMYRVLIAIAGVFIATSAFGKDPEYYVKKGTWQETLQASREAVLGYFCTSIKNGPNQYEGQVMGEAMRDEIWDRIQRDFTAAEARKQIAREISIDDIVEKTLLITGKEKVRLAQLEKH